MDNHRLELKVHGFSMSPLIKDGDFIIADLNQNEYQCGDILLFKDKQSNEYTVHRLLDLNEFKTKGDNSYLYDGNNKEVLGIVKLVTKANGAKIKLTNNIFSKLICILSKKSISKNKLRIFYRYLIKFFLTLYINQ